jgi:anthranilate phosphoribosyltransferase
MTPQEIHNKLYYHKEIDETEAYEFMLSVMRGEVPEILLSSFLTALSIFGENASELTGFVRAVRESCVQKKNTFDFDFLDTCGTGGDGKQSVNVSTLSALTLASMGIKVAKHGNRSVSSVCGSSDLLESLGYNYQVSHEIVEERFLQKGFTFLFAPAWHPAMKYAANVRKTLGFRTVFNMIGPLANPFQPTHQIVGVYSDKIEQTVAHVLKNLKLKKAIVCHSRDGLDEFSIYEPTNYYILENSQISSSLTFDPKGILPSGLSEEEFYAPTRETAVRLAKSVLAGENISSSHSVALNSGVGLYVMNQVSSISLGYQKCLDQILSKKLESYWKSLVSE